MKYIIVINLIINAFIAGMHFEENSHGSRITRSDFLFTILIFFIGLELLLLSILVDMFGWLGTLLQTRFYWNFYFTKKYSEKLTDYQVERLAGTLAKMEETENKSLCDKHIIFTFNLALKRNERIKTR